MKTRMFIMAAGLAAAAVACGQVSETTTINGTILEEGLDEVNIVVESMQIDTLVPVTDGKFVYELPTDVTTYGMISAGPFMAVFVPDGTKLEVVLDEVPDVSSSSAKSIQSRLNDFYDVNNTISDDFTEEYLALRADTLLSSEAKDSIFSEKYDAATDKVIAYTKKTINENRDNVVGAIALQNITSMMEDKEIDSLIGTLSEKMQALPMIVGIKKDIDTRIATSEGKMFIDFTIEDSDGKTVKFSDYVGKGKYVLVDFWASWCGPCKREIPNIKSVYEKYHAKGLEVLSVAVWDQPQATKDTAKVYGVNWKQIINAGQIPTDLYGIQGIPHIILFGPDGTILKRDLRGSDIEAEVAKYIN